MQVKSNFKNHSIIGNHTKLLWEIHRGRLVIILSELIGWVIDIYFITIFVRLNNGRYIFCYCTLNYDDNRIFDLYVSYMSFIIIILTTFKSVICCHFCHNIFEAVRELCKVIFSILIYTRIGKFTISIKYKKWTPNNREISGFSQ